MAITQEPKANQQNSHTQREWQRKFFGMGAKCYYCGIPMLFKEASKDHRIPRCRGGSDSIKNIVPACLPCNQKKSWRTEEEFLAVRKAFRPQVSQVIGCKETITLGTSFEERVNEPGLLKRLLDEERRGSWAWRHPA